MKLKESLINFAETFGRNGSDTGSVTINSRASADEDTLDAFYQILVFDNLLTIEGEMFMNIHPLNKLPKAQEGWGLIVQNGVLTQDNANWNANWVVFANRNDDAIYFNKEDNKVYGCIDKNTFFELSDSLSTFFAIITECMLMEQDKYDFETFDEDEETLPEFVDDISEILLRRTTKKNAEEFIGFFFE